MEVISFLVIAGIEAGPLLAEMKVTWLRRLAGWLLLGVGGVVADRVMSEVEPLFRMIGICCVLLGGMKGLVYAEWVGLHGLTLRQYEVFSLLWFGMDPGSFRAKHAGLSWRNDVLAELALMAVGTIGAWIADAFRKTSRSPAGESARAARRRAPVGGAFPAGLPERGHREVPGGIRETGCRVIEYQ